MSFNLVRHKNGMEVPIKVSVLDVFRSSPARKASTQASMTPTKPNNNNNQQKNGNQNQNLKPENSNKNKNQNSGNDNNGGHNFSNHDTETYTDADNVKIIALKAENKPWAEILTAINKESKSQLQNHFKANLQNLTAKDKKKIEERAAKGEQNKGNGQANQGGGKGKNQNQGGNQNNSNNVPSGGGGKKKNKGKDNANNPKNSNNNPKSNKPFPAFNEDRLRNDMRAFVAKYEKDIWLMAASRHYDLTGQRISTEHAKSLWKGE